MNIGIVTIYNSQNCGSFWQCYSMQSFLSEHGYNSFVVKNNIFYRNRLYYVFFSVCKLALRGKFKDAAVLIKRNKGFVSARRKFNIKKDFSGLDACIYGSDTIWCLDAAYFAAEWKHYWGKTFNGKKIGYALSAGSTDVKKIVNRQELCDCIKKFNDISVRDDNTYNIVASVDSDKKIAKVVDPTLLMNKEFFTKNSIAPKYTDYILFYCFEKIDFQLFESIKSYAKSKNLKLICFGSHIKDCDIYIPNTPLAMPGYFNNASAIVTDTFHGCIFSVIFEKRFYCIERGKKKVSSLLKQLGLENRIISDSNGFNVICDTSVDTDAVNEKISIYRDASVEYLLNALKKCGGGSL